MLGWVEHVLGLFIIGEHPAMMVKAPLKIPELPMPATALPTISMVEETATPHRREPSSKIAKKVKKVHCHHALLRLTKTTQADVTIGVLLTLEPKFM